MTQIVYDGKHLYADRKCYAGGLLHGLSKKIQTSTTAEVKRYYAFAGTYTQCLLGEQIIASDFSQQAIDAAKEHFSKEEVDVDFAGILVEVPINPTHQWQHKVYLVNYVGMRIEMVPGEFLAEGSYYGIIRTVYDTVKSFTRYDEQPSTAEIIRFAMKGTSQDQTDYPIDRVDFLTGEFETV